MHALFRARILPVTAGALLISALLAPAAWSSPTANGQITGPLDSWSFRDAFPGIRAALAAAKKGDPAAMDYLADRYALGTDVTKNGGEAERWWNAATTLYRTRALRGDTSAMEQLALRYDRGYGRYGFELAKDPAEAIRWNKAAAAANLASAKGGKLEAMEEMARRYSSGTGVEQSEESTAKWDRAVTAAYLKRANACNLEAMDELSARYFFGTGAAKSEDSEAKWDRAAAAGYLKLARAGDLQAMLHLAEMYRAGKGADADADDSGAARWDRAAAAKGSTYAMLRLVSDYDREDNGVEAMRWTRIAANAGGRSAMYRLALDYDIGGDGLTADGALATDWYRKAALAGHAAAATALRDAHFRSVIATVAEKPRDATGVRCTTLSDDNHNRRLNAPPFLSFESESSREAGAMIVNLHAIAADPEGYNMVYTYSVTGGAVTGDGSDVTWTVGTPGTFTATVEVDDGAGCLSVASLPLVFTQ